MGSLFARIGDRIDSAIDATERLPRVLGHIAKWSIVIGSWVVGLLLIGFAGALILLAIAGLQEALNRLLS